MEIRKFWNIVEFYKTTMLLNLVVSAVTLLFGNIESFLFTFATFGFGCCLGFKEIYRFDEYLFYRNNGISKASLLGYSFIINLLFTIGLLVVVVLIQKIF